MTISFTAVTHPLAPPLPPIPLELDELLELELVLELDEPVELELELPVLLELAAPLELELPFEELELELEPIPPKPPIPLPAIPPAPAKPPSPPSPPIPPPAIPPVPPIPPPLPPEPELLVLDAMPVELELLELALLELALLDDTPPPSPPLLEPLDDVVSIPSSPQPGKTPKAPTRIHAAHVRVDFIMMRVYPGLRVAVKPTNWAMLRERASETNFVGLAVTPPDVDRLSRRRRFFWPPHDASCRIAPNHQPISDHDPNNLHH